MNPHQQIDTGLDHGRRVQIGRDGRRGLHGVAQPVMEGELCRFGKGPAEHQKQHRRVCGAVAQHIAAFEQSAHFHRTAHMGHQDQACQQGKDHRRR